METPLILITAAITIVWSLRTYLHMSDRVGIEEESPLRIVNIIAPSAYFLTLVFASWRETSEIRLDLIGLVALNVITIVTIIFSFLLALFAKTRHRTIGLLIFAIYHLLSLLVVISTFVVQRSPNLLDQATAFVERLAELDLFSFAWVGLDTEEQQQDVVGFLNRILIAVLSYLPIAILRLLTGIRHRRKIEREVDQLKRRRSALEDLTDNSEI